MILKNKNLGRVVVEIPATLYKKVRDQVKAEKESQKHNFLYTLKVFMLEAIDLRLNQK